MDTDMGFGNDDNAGDALGAELMKRVSDDGCVDALGGGDKGSLNGGQIIQGIGVTIAKFHQHMRP